MELPIWEFLTRFDRICKPEWIPEGTRVVNELDCGAAFIPIAPARRELPVSFQTRRTVALLCRHHLVPGPAVAGGWTRWGGLSDGVRGSTSRRLLESGDDEASAAVGECGQACVSEFGQTLVDVADDRSHPSFLPVVPEIHLAVDEGELVDVRSGAPKTRIGTDGRELSRGCVKVHEVPRNEV